MIQNYYYWLSTLTRLLSQPLSDLTDQVNVPLISALVFGLIGAFAPCQLSTGVAALSFLARRSGEPQRLWSQTLAYLAGKASVHLGLGGLMVMAGLQISALAGTAIPLVVFARKLLGPLLIVAGLLMVGLLKRRFSAGERLSATIEQRVGRANGVAAAFGLGVAFSLTFCPTLFWLFFGLTVPLALATPGGLVLPAVFALGTTLPLLAFAVLMTAGVSQWPALLRRMRTFDQWDQPIMGLVFLLVGLNEVILYWLL